MSSTSEQIDQAKKLAAKVEAGEYVPPPSTSHVAAEQITAQTPPQPEIDIPEDATMEGLNRENIQPAEEQREAIPVVHDREIAPVVGTGQEQPLAKQFLNPTERAEEQTALPEDLRTSAEKQTAIGQEQIEKEERLVEAHKEEQEEQEEKKAEAHEGHVEHDWHEGHKEHDQDEDVVLEKKEETKTVVEPGPGQE